MEETTKTDEKKKPNERLNGVTDVSGTTAEPELMNVALKLEMETLH